MTNLYALNLAALSLLAAFLMAIALHRGRRPGPAETEPARGRLEAAAKPASWSWRRRRFAPSAISRREARAAGPRHVIVYVAGAEGLKRTSGAGGTSATLRRPLYKIGVTKSLSTNPRIDALGATGYASVTLTSVGPVAEAGFERWFAERLGAPRQALGSAIRLLSHGLLVRLPSDLSPAQFEARLRVGLMQAFRRPTRDDQGELFAEGPARFTPKAAGYLALACELVSFRPRSREDMTILVALIQRLLESDGTRAQASVEAPRAAWLNT